jgi:hypothetical protein
MPTVIALFVLMLVAGATFVVAGVHLLLGIAWAFIVCGVLLFAGGVYLRAGIRPNG